MIISMKLHATKEEVEAVCERIREFGYKVHSIEGEERVVIGVVGVGDVTACLESLEAMPQVEKAVRISAPYKFVSKEFRPERTDHRGQPAPKSAATSSSSWPAPARSRAKSRSWNRRSRRRARREVPARRRVQAAHLALRFPGHGSTKA